MSGKSGKGSKNNAADIQSEADHTEVIRIFNYRLHAENDSILLRVAILGDAEPKPLAEFPNMDAAVEQINTLMQTQPIDFVIGVGDIAHKGTEIQYEAATRCCRN
jgi:hypothetical protein